MRPLSIAVAVLLAATGTAAAQPGATPAGAPPSAPPSGPIVLSEKSPGTALVLSLGGTIGSIALAGYDVDNDGLATLGGLGLWLAPSFGHWYAGDGWTTGLTYRLAGGGLAVAALAYGATQCTGIDERPEDEDCVGGLALLGAAGIAFVGGTIYDIATAPGAARRHNERQRTMLQGYAVQPAISRDRAGVMLTGRF